MRIANCSLMKNSGEVECILPKDFNELKNCYLELKEKGIKHTIIGAGSNTLISEKYTGRIIKLTELDYSYEIYPDEIYVSAFYPTTLFASEMAKEGYDYSFLSGIPGLLGGAVYNNVGAFGEAISDYVLYVNYLNSNGDIVRFDCEKLMFSYRYSIFKDIEGIIVGIALKKQRNKNVERKIREFLQRRKENLPNNPSLGSIFKNNQLIKAWKVIDKLGLRGYQIGGAAFSNKHANVIINVDNASFSDVRSLILCAKKRAYEELGIVLEEEITIIE